MAEMLLITLNLRKVQGKETQYLVTYLFQF